jgi:hypothetical protein
LTVDKTLIEYATPRQAEIIKALIREGTTRKAAAALGVNRSTVRSAIDRCKKKAAVRGHSPDHDMTKTTPDGFHVQGVSTLYDGEGNLAAQWVKTKKDNSAEAREAIIEATAAILEPYRRKSKTTKAPKYKETDQISVYGWGDMHVGMLSWRLEVGADYDLGIAEDIMAKAVDRGVEAAPSTKNALLIFVGDNMHSNGPDARTPASKHILDVDGRFVKIVETCIRMMRYNIDRALEKHAHVQVIIEPGNHDPDTSMLLPMMFRMFYEGNKRVTINDKPGRIHTHRFGKCFFGVTHGDKIPANKLPLMMATRWPDDWAASTFRHWYTGHVHHLQAKEFSGATVETLRTLAAKDAYAWEHGLDSQRATIVDTWHADKGRLGRTDIYLEAL